MIAKPTKFIPPLTEDQIIALETFLSNVGRQAGRISSGSYTGDGVSGKQITVGFAPAFLVISKQANLGTEAFPLSGNMVLSLQGNTGVSYLPGIGFVNDAVLSYSNTGFTIGVNASVNALNVPFIYFAIG